MFVVMLLGSMNKKIKGKKKNLIHIFVSLDTEFKCLMNFN